MESEKITFSFGKNWQDFLKATDKESYDLSRQDMERWLNDRFDFSGKKVIDIGSGSGIHSFILHTMQPDSLLSFDYDQHSVAATKSLWEKAGSPKNWIVEHGSVLDKNYLQNLGLYDLVYSWGVLHHTGKMWEAIKNASEMVKPGGYFLISIYQGVKTYDYDLALKRKYNKSGYFGKKYLEFSKFIWPLMKEKMEKKQNPLGWNTKYSRGMNRYHNIIDWLGGLPYEVASDKQITDFLSPLGFTLLEKDMTEACGTYLMKKS